jgi:hypothetical protein
VLYLKIKQMETQTISRENLKKIYDVACSGWKTKIEDYAKRNPFKDDIDFTQNEVNEMFNASDDKQKSVLSKIFKQSLNITDKIKSFNDVVLNDEENSILMSLVKLGNKKFIALYKLELIIKALNEGWYPDWNNESEYKYFNYFRMKGVFSYSFTLNYTTTTFVPSALCLKSQLLAEYAVKIALEEYKEYYL